VVKVVMQWANRGGGQSLSNHRLRVILVSLIYEEGLRFWTSFDVLERAVFQAGAGGSFGLLG